MALADLLQQDAVVPNLRVNSKKQLLQELAAKASKLTNIPEREIFDVILQRERLGSTGVVVVKSSDESSCRIASAPLAASVAAVKAPGVAADPPSAEGACVGGVGAGAGAGAKLSPTWDAALLPSAGVRLTSLSPICLRMGQSLV